MIIASLFANDMELEAISFIQDNYKEEFVYEVGFSGGKDSIVTLDLVKRSGIKYVAYYNQSLEPPSVQKLIREEYPDVLIRKPVRSYFEEIKRKGSLPVWNNRWCCDFFKKKSSSKSILILGTRREESQIRRAYSRIRYKGKKLNALYPVFFWTTDDIWAYIHKNELKYPDVYDYANRVGCLFCPLQGAKNMAVEESQFPGYYKAFRQFMDEYWESDNCSERKRGMTKEMFDKYPFWFSREKGYKVYQKEKDKWRSC